MINPLSERRRGPSLRLLLIGKERPRDQGPEIGHNQSNLGEGKQVTCSAKPKIILIACTRPCVQSPAVHTKKYFTEKNKHKLTLSWPFINQQSSLPLPEPSLAELQAQEEGIIRSWTCQLNKNNVHSQTSPMIHNTSDGRGKPVNCWLFPVSSMPRAGLKVHRRFQRAQFREYCGSEMCTVDSKCIQEVFSREEFFCQGPPLHTFAEAHLGGKCNSQSITQNVFFCLEISPGVGIEIHDFPLMTISPPLDPAGYRM